MNRDELKSEYFDWMCQLVCGEGYPKRLSHRKLLSRLHDTVFFYTIAMDGNREADGIDLRYRFGYEKDYTDAEIAECLDDRPCSVLEMLIALAIRCEEHIMDDPDIGNRTGQWFWIMIENLGLRYMDDDRYREQMADHTISRFLNREYAPNGDGGLFTVNNDHHDLRTAEIWYQMCWYLDSIL